MKIAILNGSPRKNGCSAAMANAFAEGDAEAKLAQIKEFAKSL